MKEGLFKMMKLNDFSRITYGYTEKSKENASKYKYLRITDIQNSSVNWDNVPFCDIQDEPFKKYELKKGDLVFARTGATTGKSFLINSCPLAVYASYLIRVQINNSQIFENYIQYYFQSQSYWNEIAGGISGSAQGGFNAKKLGDLEIPIPPLSEQQAIVEKLDFVFDAIEKAKANIEKNIDNTKELFQSKLNEIFSQKGEGWEEKKIEEVCESIVAGGDAPKNNFSTERNDNFPIPIYANAVKLDGLYGYTDLCKIKKPSLTIAARGSGTGFTCIRLEPFFPIVRLLVLTPNESIDLQFLKLSVDNQVIRASGSAIPQFTVPMLKMLSIYLPKTLKEQEKIVSQLDQLSEQTNVIQEKYKQKLDNLEELKKSILEKAFKGELVVENCNKKSSNYVGT